MPDTMKLYKFARRLADGRVVSDYDGITEWKIGQTNEVAPPAELCAGLNACGLVADAREYVNGDVLMLVEASGVHLSDGEKYTHQRQTPLKMWDASEYEKVRGPAWAEYEKVRDAARAEYEKARDPARAEYEKVCDSARAEYEKVCGPAWAEYEKVCGAARAEYGKSVQRAICTEDKEFIR